MVDLESEFFRRSQKKIDHARMVLIFLAVFDLILFLITLYHVMTKGPALLDRQILNLGSLGDRVTIGKPTWFELYGEILYLFFLTTFYFSMLKLSRTKAFLSFSLSLGLYLILYLVNVFLTGTIDLTIIGIFIISYFLFNGIKAAKDQEDQIRYTAP